ncbi:hypothetical protein NBRC116188_17870 [Oceaniserpentilla sp. 4NH20-0058]|uniref:hypothetical protein n=1 Tax=Oceaniserpentilla sp. 4NH20-0058 TaxID=3127660 RepID=UPI0031074673
MRVLAVLLSVMWATVLVGAEVYLLPAQPSNNQIQQVFDRELAQNLLFHKPFDLPIEVERTHKAMIKSLTPWVQLGFVSQEKTRFMADKIMYGEPREVSVGGFKFSYNQENPLVSDQGIFYGRPKMHKIFEVSQVVDISGEYFCEVYLSWHAVDLPKWLDKVNLKKRENRMLRRARESQSRPFEKRVQLINKDGEWHLWSGRGERKVKQQLF